MKHLMRAGAIAVAGLLGGAAAAVTPIHMWNFNDGTARDLVGSLDGTLNGNAVISGGQLRLNGQTASNGVATYMSTGTDNIALTAMTLVSWVSLANLTQGGGSALSVVDPNQAFDAIDYGEATSGQWLNGSDYASRSRGNNGGAIASDLNEHMMAITYGADGKITIYKDGALYADGGTFAPFTFTNEHYLVGLRHEFGGNAMLAGSVDMAAVYSSALSSSDIASLYSAGPSGAVPEPATWTMMILGFGAIGTALRRRPRSSVRFG